MNRPRLLDLFCGAGGAAMGYHRAGFDVVGVDIEPQPDYPFEFHQGDALEWPKLGPTWWADLRSFDAIHASPPCQHYSALKVLHPDAAYVDLYERTRKMLQATGLPWVIENVAGAPYHHGVMLCGSHFGLRMRRHRNFESSWLILSPGPCRHTSDILGVYGASDGKHPPGFTHPGWKRGPRQATTEEAREIMDMPWVSKRKGLTEAIPPAYTEWIGRELLVQMEAAA